MDLSDYEKSATIRAFIVLRKAEEICRECKYGQITPHVIFAAMTMLEKDFLLEVFDQWGLDYNVVCKACELELRKIQPVVDVCDCRLSESAQKLLSTAREYMVISLDSLMLPFISCPEMESVFGHSAAYLWTKEILRSKCDTFDLSKDFDLKFDTLSGKFIFVNRCMSDYIDGINPRITTGGFF